MERMVKHEHVQSYEEWDAEEQVREAAEVICWGVYYSILYYSIL